VGGLITTVIRWGFGEIIGVLFVAALVAGCIVLALIALGLVLSVLSWRYDRKHGLPSPVVPWPVRKPKVIDDMLPVVAERRTPARPARAVPPPPAAFQRDDFVADGLRDTLDRILKEDGRG
jgi:hypothetical protein